MSLISPLNSFVSLVRRILSYNKRLIMELVVLFLGQYKLTLLKKYLLFLIICQKMKGKKTDKQ